MYRLFKLIISAFETKKLHGFGNLVDIVLLLVEIARYRHDVIIGIKIPRREYSVRMAKCIVEGLTKADNLSFNHRPEVPLTRKCEIVIVHFGQSSHFTQNHWIVFVDTRHC